jgi:hypothetical protein
MSLCLNTLYRGRIDTDGDGAEGTGDTFTREGSRVGEAGAGSVPVFVGRAVQWAGTAVGVGFN